VKQDNHINRPQTSNQHTIGFEQLNDRLSIPHVRSVEEVWQEMEPQLASPVNTTVKIPARRYYRLTIAALLVLLLGSTAIIRLYTKTIHSGQQTRAICLPDGSVAYLNMQSKLTYYPLWWSFSRELRLTGEAYFQVKKGKRFSVRSLAGITTVMGTSFDIYARNDSYKVTCLSGRVKVIARKSNDQVILNPNNSAEVDVSGIISYHARIPARNSISWKQNFVFTNTPLKQVIENLEKRYNVQIDIKTNQNYYYSGTIPSRISIEEALNLICKPFGLTFVRKSNQIYQIL